MTSNVISLTEAGRHIDRENDNLAMQVQTLLVQLTYQHNKNLNLQHRVNCLVATLRTVEQWAVERSHADLTAHVSAAIERVTE